MTGHEIYFIVYRPTGASLMETEMAVGQERARCLKSMHRMSEMVEPCQPPSAPGYNRGGGASSGRRRPTPNVSSD